VDRAVESLQATAAFQTPRFPAQLQTHRRTDRKRPLQSGRQVGMRLPGGQSGRVREGRIQAGHDTGIPLGTEWNRHVANSQLGSAGEEQPPHFRVPCVWKTTTGLQASGALAGSRVLATNCNPLAAREPGSDGRADLGVVLKGKGLAERCAARLGLPLNGEETGPRL